MSFNSITVVGNLGRDPELRYTPQGTAVCNFSMASNEKRQGEEIVTWFRVTAWGRQAENVAKFLAKGDSCYVLGTLRVEEFERRDSTSGYSLEVNASDVKFLGKAGDGQGRPLRDLPDEGAVEKTPDDDIPF